MNKKTTALLLLCEHITWVSSDTYLCRCSCCQGKASLWWLSCTYNCCQLYWSWDQTIWLLPGIYLRWHSILWCWSRSDMPRSDLNALWLRYVHVYIRLMHNIYDSPQTWQPVLVAVQTVKCDWLVGQMSLKAEWKCVSTKLGEQCAITTGML